MVHFGFSYIGLIWLIMLFVPNSFWTKNKPADYDRYVKNENKVLLALERVGEVLTTVCAVIFSDFNLRRITVWSLWLLASFIFMILYELYWIGYFKSPKTMADMYRSFAGFPYGSNIFLIVSSLILSVGHIGIHLMHRAEVVPPKKKKAVVRILKVLLLIPVTAGLVVTVTAIAGRNIYWFKNCIDTSKGINECIYVPIGGQEQYIQIRGRDTDNPVILYIHGGPGGPDSAVSPLFTDGLTDSYTVVCWDQRGCGRTYFRNMDLDPQNQTVNFETAVSDTDDLVEYICDRFGTDRVILMGHSYGTMVGTRYILEHSEKVSAYIGIGQFVNSARSDEASYEDAMAIARSRGEDTTELQNAYEAYCRSGMLSDYLVFRSLAYDYHPAANTADTIGYAFFCPYTGVDDVRWILCQMDTERFTELEQSLLITTSSYDVYDQGLTYDVPMLMILGESDYVCNCSLAEGFYNDLNAPVKDCVVINGGGHTPHYETPDRFAQAVLSFLEEI